MTLLETLTPHFQSSDSWKKEAFEVLQRMGFPTKKWEAFRYVSFKGLNEFAVKKFEQEGISLSNTQGIIALPFKEAMRSYGALLQKGFKEALQEETNPFALLNTAFAAEGLFLYIPPGKSIELDWTLPSVEAGACSFPKLEIYVGKGASFTATCQFKGEGSYFHNQHIQITLDEGAHASLSEQLEHSSEGFAMHTLRAKLKRDAIFKSFVFSKGAALERHDARVVLLGENSEADLRGLSLPGGKDEIHHYLHMRHAAPQCRSNQHFKTALMGRARSSFEGKIYVDQIAQQTEAYQLNNNLLLSPKAQAMSKPNLEILADDVKASHGATCAQPRGEELFYMRARGFSEKEARKHLARGFCRELLKGDIVDHYLNQGQEDESF